MSRLIARAAAALVVALAASGMVLAADKAGKTAKPKDDVKPKESEAAGREVALALKAEAAGDNAEREAHLAAALELDPALPAANWHAAKVFSAGEWLALEEASDKAAASPQLAEYRTLRDKAEHNPKLIRGLAHWCLKMKLPDLARLHYGQLLANPQASADAQAEAVKHLDLHAVGGAWLTGEEVKTRQAAQQQIMAALAHWRPEIKSLQLAIDGFDFDARKKALQRLSEIDDPQLIAVLESFLVDGGAEFHGAAVKKLAKFPQYEATVALVHYAVLSNAALARKAAGDALRERPMHEYVPLLLAGLTSPIKSQFQITWDPRGRVGYKHAFLREGTTGNLLLVSYGLTSPVNVSRNYVQDDSVRVYGPQAHEEKTRITFGVSKAVAMAQQQAAALARAAATEQQVNQFNAAAQSSNERVFEALEQTTNQQTPRDPVQWWDWWQNYNEYQWARPTNCLYQYSQDRYCYGITNYTHITGTRNHSCFVAGTLVRTELGPVAIETIKAGDRVLSQEQTSGELKYQIVLVKTVRPPSKTVRIRTEKDTIVTTLGHPFWVEGHGWKMAKELVAGDLLHSLHGAVTIESVDPDAVQEAHNLVVDGFNTYFVGEGGLLVHDNEFRRPTRVTVPGLIE